MMRAGRWILDNVFPPRCPVCSEASRQGHFCETCRAKIAFARSPLCTSCGLPFPGAGVDHPCTACLLHPPGFDRARACALYEGSSGTASPLAKALHRYKYGGDVTIAPVLARILIERCPLPLEHDVVVPVPLHIGRLRRRGFNQSLLLARPLAKRYGLVVSPFLIRRTRDTEPQVKLDRSDRERNVAGAFAVTDPTGVHGRSILLVDDVYTTGATVGACAASLRRAGARRVDVLVLARAGGAVA